MDIGYNYDINIILSNCKIEHTMITYCNNFTLWNIVYNLNNEI